MIRDTLEETKIRETTESSSKKFEERRPVTWINLVFLTFFLMAAPYGLYLSFTSAKLYTTIFAAILYPLSMMGITAGVHRLWSHRAFKATMPLQIILMILNTMAFQGSIYGWARDHRLHHKYSDTDADPHNAKRGFIFAHVGWIYCKKHPDVAIKGKGIDVADLRQDPVLAFQRKYYFYLAALVCVFVPTIVPVYLWNETWSNAFYIAFVFRYVLALNSTWLINSAAHLYGQKPYDININPTENQAVSVATFGEGWHNYHHTFPWDYKNAELGNYTYNMTTAFIDLFAYIGWAYDLKTVSMENVRQRVKRTGDGTHDLWGWGDNDQTQKERDYAILTHARN